MLSDYNARVLPTDDVQRETFCTSHGNFAYEIRIPESQSYSWSAYVDGS